MDYEFHDYKSEGVDEQRLKAWVGKLGWETVLNRAGPTFRNLSDAEKRDLNASKAIALMLKYPSLIKRPLLDAGNGTLIAGFKPEFYAPLKKRGG